MQLSISVVYYTQNLANFRPRLLPVIQMSGFWAPTPILVSQTDMLEFHLPSECDRKCCLYDLAFKTLDLQEVTGNQEMSKWPQFVSNMSETQKSPIIIECQKFTEFASKLACWRLIWMIRFDINVLEKRVRNLKPSTISLYSHWETEFKLTENLINLNSQLYSNLT